MSKRFAVQLPTFDPYESDLVRFMVDNRIVRAEVRGCPPGFEEFVYEAGTRAVLAQMVREFWGDNGDDENIEEVSA